MKRSSKSDREGTGRSKTNTSARRVSGLKDIDRKADRRSHDDDLVWDDEDGADCVLNQTFKRQPIVEHYIYRGRDLSPLYVVCRTTDKQFPVQQPDGAWGWKHRKRRVLYRLPEVIEAIKCGDTIYVVEGEKDVHAVEDAGEAATCFPGGGVCGSRELDALNALGRHGGAADVVVWQDKDDTGRKRARNTIARLVGMGVPVRLVEAARGKDAADHLAAGLGLDDVVDVPLPETSEGEQHGGAEALSLVLNVLENVRQEDDDQYMARCPAHDDDNPSLAVKLGDTGTVKFHCFAGCTEDGRWPEFLSILRDLEVPPWAIDGDGERSGSSYLLLSDVVPTRVRWLWPGRIPLGKLTIIDGDPERGKSLITLDLAARVSSGGEMPDACPGLDEPAGVILTCAEDDIEDTIAPRLLAHGADLDRVATIPLRRDEDSGEVVPLTFPEDLGRIRTAVRELKEQRGVDVRLIVIDPITAYLSESINSHSDASVRRATTPLTEAAQGMGAAVVMVRHLNKQGELKAAYRGGGSIAFTAAARSAIIVDEHPDVPGQLVMARVKNNLAAPVPSLAYMVVGDEDFDVPRIEWVGPVTLDADALLRGHDGRRDAPAREEAEHFLREVLADGPVPSKDVKADAKAAGLSWSTVKRAKQRLKIRPGRITDKDGKTIRWDWQLPDPFPEDGPTVKFEVRARRGGR